MNKAGDIVGDEGIDIPLRVIDINRDPGPEKWGLVADCVDADGDAVRLVQFENNDLGVELSTGQIYQFEDVEPDNWNGTGINTSRRSKAERIETFGGTSKPKTTAEDLLNGETKEKVDIRLHVEDRADATNEKVAFYAGCTDIEGEEILLTIFDDNRPPVDIEVGRTYDLRGARNDTHEGRPGVSYLKSTDITQVSLGDTVDDYATRAADSDDSEGQQSSKRQAQRELVDEIEGLITELEDGDVSSARDPKVAVLLNGIPTALGVGISVFAGGFGIPSVFFWAAVGLLAGAVVSYATLYQEYLNVRSSASERLIRLLLESLRDQYEETYGDHHLRLTVMKRERDWGEGFLPKNGRRLVHHYSTDEYEREETQHKYDVSDPERAQGVWGLAFVRDEPVVYDRETRPEEMPNLSAVMEDDIQCRSALAVPINRKRGDVSSTVGVLVLDSEEPAADVGFESQFLPKLAEKQAKLIADLL